MSNYISKALDASGTIDWSQSENQTWQTLYNRQVDIVKERACREFIDGIDLLHMSSNHVPQLYELTNAFKQTTHWTVAPVPAMITPEQFFELLATKTFPAATFIRTPEDLDYLEEPDIFHEFFGHCPMITHQPFADFIQAYGRLALSASVEDRKYLARLFWFTVEFGLIQTNKGVRCYGGGILSSKNETIYAVESTVPLRKSFDLVEVLRTPYRVDQIQGVYYVIQSFEQLYHLLQEDIHAAIEVARSLGELPLVQIDKDASKDEWITC
ncbi:MAG: phenylalanine 4-monooxygenase [Pseudomonadota bacterium]|nr:phenylalanine 4-monooxygenase [Pseudomonadota bacterium]